MKNVDLTNLPSQQQSIIMFSDAFIRLIPFVFAFLSIALKDVWNCRMNLVLGVIFTGLAFFGLASLLLQLANSQAYEFLIQVIAIMAPILILWYAFKWQKEESLNIVSF